MPGAPDVRPAPAHPRAGTIFYDGGCGLCHAFVRFVVRRDRAGEFAFAPLGGRTCSAAFPEPTAPPRADSVVLLTADGRTLLRSDAVVHVLRRLGGGWGATGAVLRVIPRPVRDFGYACVAAIRRRVFSAPPGVCPVVPSHLRGRFLD